MAIGSTREWQDGAGRVSSRLPYRAVVLAAVLIAVGLLFEQLVTLLLAVVVAVIIGLPIAAGATWLQRWRIPRPLGAILCLLAGVGALGGLLALIIPQFVDQARSFANQLPGFVAHAEHYFHLKPGTVSKTAEQQASSYTQHPSKLLGPLTSMALTAADTIGILIVILIGALYGAINPDPLIRGLVRLAPLEQRDEVIRVLGRIRTAWLGWLRGIALDMVVLGGLLFVGMKLIGLPFALGFAVFSALMTVIPNYGSVISAVPPILVGLSQSVHQAILVTVIYIIVNQIEGNFVLPLIMGRSVRVHPAAVAIGVLIAGALFGVIGLFIAIPLLSLTLIAIEELWIAPLERNSLVEGRLARRRDQGAKIAPAGCVRRDLAWRRASRGGAARATAGDAAAGDRDHDHHEPAIGMVRERAAALARAAATRGADWAGGLSRRDRGADHRARPDDCLAGQDAHEQGAPAGVLG